MNGNKKRPDGEGILKDEIVAAFERERERSRELNRQHTEKIRNIHSNDRQVLIERRRHPR